VEVGLHHRRRQAASGGDAAHVVKVPLWWHLGSHTQYHDGNKQPKYRGWIHGTGALAAFLLLAWMLAADTPFPLLGMVACKGIVYGASAAFHLVCWPSHYSERLALITDVSLVPLAILGGILPFSVAGGLGVANDCALGAAVLALNVLLVAFQFRRGHLHVPGDSTPRSLVCVAYYAYNEVVAGRALGFESLGWRLTPLLYCSAFACAAGVDKYRESCSEPLIFPHHRRGIWSLHEDFHGLLAIADVFSGWLGWATIMRGEAVLDAPA